ncbi:MAG: hypothetical protein AB8B71_08865 [Paracoccaceae bacterium]
MSSDGKPPAEPGVVTDLPGRDFFDRPENARLLLAMRDKPRFSYQQLAIASQTSVGALRKRFAEQPQWRNLLRVVGTLPTQRAGPKQKLFQLRPDAAAAIEKFVTNPGGDAPVLYFLPQVDSIKDMLINAQVNEPFAPGMSFDLHKHAAGALQRTLDYVDEGNANGTLVCSDSLRQTLSTLKDRLTFTERLLQARSENRRSSIERQFQIAARASHSEDGLPNYFFSMPKRSISGYGGAMLAQSDPARSNLEHLASYFAKRVVGEPGNFSFVEACGHSLSEVLRLSVFDREWVGIAGRLLDGIRRSTRLARQPIILDACQSIPNVDQMDPCLRQDVQSFTERHGVDRASEMPGANDLLASLDAVTA